MSLSEKLQAAAGASVGFSLYQLFWYVVFALTAWGFFHVLFRRWFRGRRIGRDDPTLRQGVRETLYSVRSIAIFGLVTGGIVYAILSGRTAMYYRIDQYGWAWFVTSIALMILAHDAYFYWTHRLMHARWLYKWVHHTHHLSTSPTPWAAYAFSPVEAFVQAGIGPLVVFTIPVHPAAFTIFMLWQIGFNVLGHCGYEVFPRWFLQSSFGWVLNTPTHHGLHHEKFRGNFGLYFNLWDRLMGTNHALYEQRFHEITDAAPQTSDS